MPIHTHYLQRLGSKLAPQIVVIHTKPGLQLTPCIP